MRGAEERREEWKMGMAETERKGKIYQRKGEKDAGEKVERQGDGNRVVSK